MVNIKDRYNPEVEIRKDSRPYQDYGDCVWATFCSDVKSFCDFGCATGLLISYLKKYFDVFGIEYFQWQKDAAPENIRMNISIKDLRKILLFDTKFDIVNCTEVGEHIEAEYTYALINNIKRIASKYIITTWADKGNNKQGQHLNPLSYNDYKKLFEGNGFKMDTELTNKFLKESQKYRDFYYWWRESLIVWRI